MIHRDLKPGNVMLTGDGKVKVLDFGLAKAMESDASNADLSNSPTLMSGRSMPGVILGTAAYMSPEQAKGRTVDKRTDIFAFGCVLYEMLTGKRSFDGDDVTDILGAVLRVEPDWTHLPVDVPPATQKLLRLCLEKNPRNRRSGAADVRLDIEQALKEPAAVGIIGSAPSRQRADGTGAAERVTKPDAEWPDQWPGAWSPDGQTLLFDALKTLPTGVEADSDWTYSLRDKKMSMFADAPFSQVENSVFSPDGRWVAYQAGPEVFVQPFPTGAKFQVTRNGGNHPVWSPDGKELFFMDNVNNGQLYSVRMRTQPSLTFGNPVPLAVKGFAQSPWFWRDYDITPDGKQFIVILPPSAPATTVPQPQQIQVVLNWLEELKQRVPVK